MFSAEWGMERLNGPLVRRYYYSEFYGAKLRMRFPCLRKKRYSMRRWLTPVADRGSVPFAVGFLRRPVL